MADPALTGKVGLSIIHEKTLFRESFYKMKSGLGGNPFP